MFYLFIVHINCFENGPKVCVGDQGYVELNFNFWQRTHRNEGKNFPFAGFTSHSHHIPPKGMLSRVVCCSVVPFSFLRTLQQRTCAYFSTTNVASDDCGKKIWCTFRFIRSSVFFCFVCLFPRSRRCSVEIKINGQ